jgi:hypothetical protein
LWNRRFRETHCYQPPEVQLLRTSSAGSAVWLSRTTDHPHVMMRRAKEAATSDKAGALTFRTKDIGKSCR